MASKINVGVVGCGYWGPNLIRNFASLHDARLRAVCDLNVQRLKHIQDLYPNVEGYTDYARFLAEGKLDAVVVATSVGLHHPMAKAALEAGNMSWSRSHSPGVLPSVLTSSMLPTARASS